MQGVDPNHHHHLFILSSAFRAGELNKKKTEIAEGFDKTGIVLGNIVPTQQAFEVIRLMTNPSVNWKRKASTCAAALPTSPPRRWTHIWGGLAKEARLTEPPRLLAGA